MPVKTAGWVSIGGTGRSRARWRAAQHSTAWCGQNGAAGKLRENVERLTELVAENRACLPPQRAREGGGRGHQAMYTISTGAVRAWAGRGAGVPPSPHAQRRSPPLAAARQRSQTLPDLPERSAALGELRRRIAAGHQPSCSHKSAGASRQQIQVRTHDGSRCTRMQQGGQDTWQTHNYHRPHSTRCFAQRCAMCCPPAALGRGSQPTPAPLHQESGAAALMRGMGPGKG